MKNLPFYLKFLGVSVFIVCAGILALSTYLNIFFLDSIAVRLSKIVGHEVDINSINVRFKDGIIFNINGLEVRSSHKNRILLSAEKFSILIAYSSLLSENIKIKKYHIRQPNIYVQHILPEFREKFSYLFLRKIGDGHSLDNKLRKNIKRNMSNEKIILITQRGDPVPHSEPLKTTTPIKNKFHTLIAKEIKKIVVRSDELIKPFEVTQARIIFNEKINPSALLSDLVGSFRIRVLRSNQNYFNLKIDNIYAFTNEYQVVGEILGVNFLSEDSLIRADVVFLSSKIQGETKLKFTIPLKNVNNVKSLVKSIDLTGSVFSKNFRLPIKIANFHLPVLDIRFKLRNGRVNYNLAAVCPRGYPQITKFGDGVITFKGGGSLNYRNDNHVTMKTNPSFSIKRCESPDYFKWLNKLSNSKILKEQNFISTNVHGKASLTIDYVPEDNNFSGKGSINIQELMLHMPGNFGSKKIMEVELLSLTDNQGTFNWGDGRLTFTMDSKFSEGDIGLQGIVNYKENRKKKPLSVYPYIKVNGFQLGVINKSSGRQFSTSPMNLSADVKVEGVIKGKNYKYSLEGFLPVFSN